ncbi:MAG: hypothetical protein IPL32_17790 [Chloracidobacterium sp.]|nr:hypothetical protein [Chloracidobacterium sp.]
MATLTVDRYLDAAACTAGEAFTLNGGRLTIRTDTRWHANSPASMTGSLGSVTISATLGGGYTIDGRNVRWMAYDAGSGNVPAIGTTVTGGTSGASGYLLGVWASMTAAPTAVGAAMPATGFLKFREVTGAYVDNDVLSGIGATANGADAVGWLEVVHDQAIAITVPRLGDFTVRGDWFDLGTTTGAANQVVQIPTNGSSTCYVPGIWIANVASPTTDDDYDFYPSIYAAAMITTNFGTDARSKFVCMETTGAIRIGHNGTASVCYVPPAGRKIRIPNVFGRQCATGTRATSAIPNATAATRPDFTTTSAGAIDIEHFVTDWYLLFAQPYAVKMHHCATFDYINVSECASAVNIYDGGNGISQTLDARTATFTSNFAGGDVLKWDSPRHQAGTTDHAFEMVYCSGDWNLDVRSGIVTYARSTGLPFQFTQCSGITGTLQQFNGPVAFTTCFDCHLQLVDHVDRYVGATNTTTGVYAVVVSASSARITVDAVTFGMGGAIANCHPYLGVFNCGQSEDITFRGLGSRAAFAAGGSANQPAYIFLSSGNNRRVKVQRCYMLPTRTGAISTTNSDKGNTYEHVYGDVADTMTIADLNSSVKNCGGTNTTTGQASVYGTHFWDAFTSDTAGRVILSLNEPTTETSGYYTVVSGTPKFTSAGNLVLATVGDEVIIESSYFVKGCTALTNTAPIVTGTNVTHVSGPDWGNHDIYYQIDTGSGYGGTWKDLTAANLSGETISPATGFRPKYRIVCDTTSTTNLLTYIRIATTSTLAAQTDNLYPLDVTTVTFTGLPSGYDAVVLTAGTSTILAQVDSAAGTTYGYTYEGTPTVDVGFIKPGYVPYYFRNLALGAADSSLPVTLTPDRNYLP